MPIILRILMSKRCVRPKIGVLTPKVALRDSSSSCCISLRVRAGTGPGIAHNAILERFWYPRPFSRRRRELRRKMRWSSQKPRGQKSRDLVISPTLMSLRPLLAASMSFNIGMALHRGAVRLSSSSSATKTRLSSSTNRPSPVKLVLFDVFGESR